MLVYVVEVLVKEDMIEEFKEATVENHGNTILESGNFRFDVLQSKENPGRFTLYEVYESEKAVQAHKETDHYKRWKEIVEEMMAKPRNGIKHRVIAPEGEEQW